MPLAAVFDTNILFSATGWRGNPFQSVERARAARAKVEKLEQALEELKKVQAAPEARAEPSERRVSATDPEARVMKQGDGGHAPSHKVQISTDVAHAIIVGADVTQEQHLRLSRAKGTYLPNHPTRSGGGSSARFTRRAPPTAGIVRCARPVSRGSKGA